MYSLKHEQLYFIGSNLFIGFIWSPFDQSETSATGHMDNCPFTKANGSINRKFTL